MMKVKAYLAAILIFNGFISYNVHAFMGPKRWAQCAFMPGKSKCSVEEKKKARKWLAYTSVIVISAIAAGIGIKMSKDEIKKTKQAAQKADERSEVAEKRLEVAEIAENIEALKKLENEAWQLKEQSEKINSLRKEGNYSELEKEIKVSMSMGMRTRDEIRDEVNVRSTFLQGKMDKMSPDDRNNVQRLIKSVNHAIYLIWQRN